MMVDRHHPGKAPTAVLHCLSDGSCLTIVELEKVLDLTRKQISTAASRLLRRDYLMRMGTGCYQLTDAGRAAAAAGEVITSGPAGSYDTVRDSRNTFRQRAWLSMRLRRRFTIPDLMTDAVTPDDKCPESNLSRYLRSLSAAGYVSELPRRSGGTALTSNGFKRWMLTQNTGPLAPVVLSKKPAIHDRNTGEDVPCSRS